MYIKKILIAFFLALVLLSPGFAYAVEDPTFGAEKAAQTAGLDKTKISSLRDPASVIGSIINLALSFIGIIFFILVLYAGFTWMTAMGNSEAVTKAKNIIEAAVIGLVLVAGAYAIANFVFSRLGSSDGGTGGGSETTVSAQPDNAACIAKYGPNGSNGTKPYGWTCKRVDDCVGNIGWKNGSGEVVWPSGGDRNAKIEACRLVVTDGTTGCDWDECGSVEDYVCCN